MPESVEAWWARRAWSKGMPVPYPIGTYRDDWQRYPVLIRQYHPELNHGITLTQIPPSAEVYLTWQCDVGHVFVATPAEQRDRPGRVRRRSTWCPTCFAGAVPRRVVHREPDARTVRASVLDAAPDAESIAVPAPAPARAVTSSRQNTPRRPPGEAFRSTAAPAPASAVEARLRQTLAGRLDIDLTPATAPNAVAVAQPFAGRFEVWPDIVIAELRVAIEYDTVGRFGLEHVGRRQQSDERKDRLLRRVGWDVVRLRCQPLLPLGSYDLVVTGVTAQTVERLLERLGSIRGHLLVAAYLK